MSTRTLLADLAQAFIELPKLLGPFSDDTLDWEDVELEARLNLVANGPLPGARLCFGHPEPREDGDVGSNSEHALPWSCPVDFEQHEVPLAGVRGLVVGSVSYDGNGTESIDVSVAAHAARATSAREAHPNRWDDAKYFLVVRYGG